MWFLVLIFVVLVVIGLYQVRKATPRSRVTCPKCKTVNRSSEIVCDNCQHKGFKPKVIVVHSVKSVFWSCRACKSPSLTSFKCKNCGISLLSLFSQ
jgi:hypothetical protein